MLLHVSQGHCLVLMPCRIARHLRGAVLELLCLKSVDKPYWSPPSGRTDTRLGIDKARKCTTDVIPPRGVQHQLKRILELTHEAIPKPLHDHSQQTSKRSYWTTCMLCGHMACHILDVFLLPVIWVERRVLPRVRLILVLQERNKFPTG